MKIVRAKNTACAVIISHAEGGRSWLQGRPTYLIERLASPRKSFFKQIEVAVICRDMCVKTNKLLLYPRHFPPDCFVLIPAKAIESPPTVSVADLLGLWPQVAKHFQLLILWHITDSLEARTKPESCEAWEMKRERQRGNTGWNNFFFSSTQSNRVVATQPNLCNENNLSLQQTAAVFMLLWWDHLCYTCPLLTFLDSTKFALPITECTIPPCHLT